MKKLNSKIPLFSKLIIKTGLFVASPLVISSSCYVPNERVYDISLDIENKGSKLSSDITFHNISDHVKVNKPAHVNLEFVSVTQTNNSLEVEYRVIDKDKSKTLPKKILVTGFKDSIYNNNVAINPNPLPYFDKTTPKSDEEPNMKLEGMPNDQPMPNINNGESNSESSPQSSTVESPENNLPRGRKIRDAGYRLSELSAYPYDLISLDDVANKDELSKKLEEAIKSKGGTNSSAEVALQSGSFFTKNSSHLEGLSINDTISQEIKSKIKTHGSDATIGYFFESATRGISVERHGTEENKKYLFKWRLVKNDGNPGTKVYEQIIDLS
ncbi:Hypothetical protein, predicted lipoprotein [Mycoplasmopsis agalactiae 14628]|uniref:Uncharacterized protein n=1 Tax=Mycoplasmopsis agalactiae 14628 TaxID=1110504 RepID=I5D5P1_MYCAA|nr:hypothetical protein [Mycoplasmopsis agalactiae]EIN15000.1 Hypothetical protein, predicted lipoprotein [Mycoplasmopsis agalactiae 14628]